MAETTMISVRGVNKDEWEIFQQNAVAIFGYKNGSDPIRSFISGHVSWWNSLSKDQQEQLKKVGITQQIWNATEACRNGNGTNFVNVAKEFLANVDEILSRANNDYVLVCRAHKNGLIDFDAMANYRAYHVVMNIDTLTAEICSNKTAVE